MENLENENVEESGTEKKRGFWLSAFLILMFIANPLTAFLYFSNPEAIVNTLPNATVGLIYFLGTMTLVNIVLAISIWKWKKWGVYGFFVIVAIAFVTNIHMGVGILGALTGLLGGVIIYITTKNRWQHFS